MEGVITVVGATGQQGSAVTEHLLAAGWHVRAVTRDPSVDKATALERRGAQLVRADMADLPSLVAAMAGTHGVFSVQPTVGSPGTAPGFTSRDEIRWGRTVAGAAHEAGVAHLVYSSVCGAARSGSELLPTNVESKAAVERHIAAVGVPATVLRPVSFMENFTGGYALRDGVLSTGLAPDVRQQLIAVDDVGAVVAQAFASPADWIGRSVDLAADDPTPRELSAAVSAAIGRPLPYAQVPMAVLREYGEEVAFANRWLNELGYRADIAAARRIRPEMLDLRSWLARTGAALISAYLDDAAA